MKKKILTIILYIILIIIGFSLWYFSFFINPVLMSLPDYKTKSFYTSGGGGDYTDYAKYTFDSVNIKKLKKSKYFKKITNADVKEILLYINDFEKWVESTSSIELKENYDFDKNIVSKGDFFYIETKEGEPIGQGTYDKYDNYDVYYFDVENSILYYFHNNI